MLKTIGKLILITLIPAFELRASIPVGIHKYNESWPIVFVVCVVANIILGIAWFWALEHVMAIATKIKPVGRMWQWYVDRTQKRIKKGVDKWGEWAVAVFIGIPLPGSGVYTGALAAYLVGLSFKKFMVANALGVLIAAVIVTALSVLGGEGFEWAKAIFVGE